MGRISQTGLQFLKLETIGKNFVSRKNQISKTETSLFGILQILNI